MSEALESVAWEDCLLDPRPDRDVASCARRELGGVPASIVYFGYCPWFARALARLNYSNRKLASLDLPTADIVCMTVSQEGSCRYCYATSRALLRIQGMSEEQVRQIEQAVQGADAERRVAAAVRFARHQARSNPLVTREQRQELFDAGFSTQEVKELAYVAAYTQIANCSATVVAVPFREMEEMPGRIIVRVMRPLIAMMLRRTMVQGEPEQWEGDPDLPFGYLPAALQGSPAARLLAEMLRDLWAPSVLSRRCKALLFAVVARTLNCPLSLAEARKILAGEGMDAETLDGVLRHLRWEQFDAAEAALVPFARHTVWYRPDEVQRQAKSVLEALGPEQFTEGVAVLSIANACCRLGAALLA